MHETEAKIRLEPGELDAVRERLRAADAQPGRIDDEDNLLFDDASGGIRGGGQTLRLRRYAGRAEATLTFKGVRDASSRYKSREELEVEVSDGGEAERILLAMGFRPTLSYAKHRESWTLPGATVALDSVTSGDYIEVEGTEQVIDHVLAKLGLEARAHITAGYASLAGKPLARRD